MTTIDAQGISIYYQTHGDPENPPVLLVSGLGGTGKSWDNVIDRFAANHYVIVPDQRGTGQSTHAQDGYTIAQMAADMASVVEHLAIEPVHVIGASTGGAIGQHLALDYPHCVRSLTLVASFARFDAFVAREFMIRRKMAAEWDSHTLLTAYAIFLFSPKYTREHPERVTAWIDRTATRETSPADRDIAVKRIDMVASHDTLARLGDIRQPTLVICGEHDFCTPLPLSEEIAAAIPFAELSVIDDCGHLVEDEKPEEYFHLVTTFIDRHH